MTLLLLILATCNRQNCEWQSLGFFFSNSFLISQRIGWMSVCQKIKSHHDLTKILLVFHSLRNLGTKVHARTQISCRGWFHFPMWKYVDEIISSDRRYPIYTHLNRLNKNLTHFEMSSKSPIHYFWEKLLHALELSFPFAVC